MNEQRVPFPPRRPFRPRMPFPRKRMPGPFKNSGWKLDVPDKYPQKGTGAPANIPETHDSAQKGTSAPANIPQTHDSAEKGTGAPANNPQRHDSAYKGTGAPASIQQTRDPAQKGTGAPANNPQRHDSAMSAKHSEPRLKAAPVKKHPQTPSVSTPYSCSELLEALKSIGKVVQCCSCHKRLSSARTCTAGHGICWNCKNRCGKVCPLCESPITDSKPVMLNNIIKLLPRSCNFAEKGCNILVLAGDLDHEAYCRFRNVICRKPSCGAKCMAKDLLYHLEGYHGKDIIRTATFNSILMDFDAKIEKDGLAVIVAYNNIIWQHTRSGKNCLLQFYQFVPMEKPKLKLSVEVNFYTPEARFSDTTPIHTDLFDPNQLFKDKETFCLPRKVASSFSSFYGGTKT